MNVSENELIKSKIDKLDIDELKTIISRREKKWNLNSTDEYDLENTIPFVGHQFFEKHEKKCISPEIDLYGFPTIEPNFGELIKRWEREKDVMGSLINKVRNENWGKENFNESLSIEESLNRLVRHMYDGFLNISAYWRKKDRILDARKNEDINNWDHPMFRSTTCCLDDISSYQWMIFWFLDNLETNNLKRYKGWCCEEITTPDNKKTRAWKRKYEIKEYVYRAPDRIDRFEAWKNLTDKPSLANECVKYLNNCYDSQFQEINKNRNMWSFRNGIFFANDPYDEKTNFKFYEYGEKPFYGLSSCKYFDLYFDKTNCEIEDWWDISTPFFKSIMDYQGFEPDVQKWMYVFGGRLCFEVGEHDAWQVIPFLKGIAKSGKSTLITKVFKKFYESEDVKTLSNNIERKFGLSSIYDGLMFIAPEVKGDLALEQAEFQSLVSGEDVSIAVKHEKAKSFEWKVPGILGGNEVPNWKDNSGSILRRIVTWNFGKQVKDADPQLDVKLESELPNILVKCVRAYLEYAGKYANKDVWNILPVYFKNVQSQVAQSVSSLQNFLESTKIRYGKDLFVPQTIFVMYFNQHCQENNLGRFKFNSDFYAGAFSSRDIEVKKMDKVIWEDTEYINQQIIYGLTIPVSDSLSTSDKLEITDDGS